MRPAPGERNPGTRPCGCAAAPAAADDDDDVPLSQLSKKPKAAVKKEKSAAAAAAAPAAAAPRRKKWPSKEEAKASMSPEDYAKYKVERKVEKRRRERLKMQQNQEKKRFL